MNQGKSQAAITVSAEAASTTLIERTEAAGEANGPARGARGGTARPKQAGKRQSKTGSGPRDAKPPKAKAQADGAAASKAESDTAPTAAAAPSKLDQLVTLLRTPGGATLPELQSATGWQVHSVRGAMAGALRKKGYSIVSEKPEGELRRYRIAVTS
ncbi:MAG: DUF3489 domain-containing protein [Proteobacteria bacterium]|nr:DUF3489 domain-containing protein [Pseudomonadota bacterium]